MKPLLKDIKRHGQQARSDNLIRLSVDIEDINDLVADLDCALSKK